MITVLLVGNGNVATHLKKAFLNAKNVAVTQIKSRNLDIIPKADVTIIAVSDNAIAKVSAKINNPFVVHTSGAFAKDNLKNNTHKGVFYMLQSFTKEKEIDFSKVPFCLEADTKKEYQLLNTLATAIKGTTIYKIDSNQRKKLHVAAVFVNNFTNHLFKIGNDICKESNIPFQILQPLIEETFLKIQTLSPEQSQTGPAVRNDTKTIENHLELLNENQQKIYTILTKSIQNGN